MYSNSTARPQQLPDGNLSDLLSSGQSGRGPQQPGMQAGTSPNTFAVTPSAQPRAPFQHPALQTRPSSQAIHQQTAQQPAQLLSALAQPMRPTAGQTYWPTATSGQPRPFTSQHMVQALPASLQWAQPHLQLRPGQATAVGAYQQVLPTSTSAMAQQYNAIVSSLRPGLAPSQHLQYAPVPQLSAEDRRVLPNKSLKRKAIQATGDATAEMEPELEAALVNIADELITNSVALACGMARRRNAKKLEASDIVVFLEQIWQLRVPGFSGSQVRPYKRAALKEMHEARLASIRKETNAASQIARQIDPSLE